MCQVTLETVSSRQLVASLLSSVTSRCRLSKPWRWAVVLKPSTKLTDFHPPSGCFRVFPIHPFKPESKKNLIECVTTVCISFIDYYEPSKSFVTIFFLVNSCSLAQNWTDLDPTSLDLTFPPSSTFSKPCALWSTNLHLYQFKQNKSSIHWSISRCPPSIEGDVFFFTRHKAGRSKLDSGTKGSTDYLRGSSRTRRTGWKVFIMLGLRERHRCLIPRPHRATLTRRTEYEQRPGQRGQI